MSWISFSLGVVVGFFAFPCAVALIVGVLGDAWRESIEALEDQR